MSLKQSPHLLKLLLSVMACGSIAFTASRYRRVAASSAPAAAAVAAPSMAVMRVVSVGSSTTETVYALGAGSRVVGVDTSSLFPPEVTALAQVGYQRALAAEGLLSLKPTMLLGGSESGPSSVLDQMRAAGVKVEIVPLTPTVEGARERIRRIAELIGVDPASVLARLEADLTAAKTLVERSKTRPRVLVLYARGGTNIFAFGRNTATDAMLALAGADNAMSDIEGTKPVTPESLVAAKPDVIVMPTRGLEMLGGNEGLLKVPGVRQTPAGKAQRFVTMDDVLLLGFGPRTGIAASELARKVHSDLTEAEPTK